MGGDESAARFSDGTAPTAVARAGPRTIPAVLMVLVALLASGRAAEGLGPVGRSMASEAAAVRILSDAIVRAVRHLAEDSKPVPASVPTPQDEIGDLARIARVEFDRHDSAWPGVALLGWHVLDRPPPRM